MELVGGTRGEWGGGGRPLEVVEQCEQRSGRIGGRHAVLCSAALCCRLSLRGSQPLKLNTMLQTGSATPYAYSL